MRTKENYLKQTGVFQIMLKKTMLILIALSVSLAAAGCGAAKKETVTEGTAVSSSAVLSAKVSEITSHGNVTLDVAENEMKSCGMNVGDIVTVSIADKEYDMPIGTNYTDVDNGEMVCRFDEENDEYKLAINMGSFAEVTGIGEENTDAGESDRTRHTAEGKEEGA